MHLLFTQVHFLFWQPDWVGGQYTTLFVPWNITTVHVVSHVMWTQPPNALRTMFLVWCRPMVFYSLCKMRVTSEAMSICNWSGRLVFLFFRFDLLLGRKFSTWLYVFFFFIYVCYVVDWALFYASVGGRILLYILAFYTHDSGVSWMDTFEQKVSHQNSSKQIEGFYVLVTLSQHSSWVVEFSPEIHASVSLYMLTGMQSVT